MEKLDKLPFTDKKPIFKQLEKLAEYANLHKDDKWAYWQAMDQIACTEDVMEQRYEEGMAEGIAEGEARGKAEAEAKAHEEKLASAYTLFMSGALTLEQIASAMKLDLDELSNYIIDKQKAEKQE